MALFKKKKDVRELRLPELPSSLAFPELPKEEEHEMPSLPQLRPMPQMPQLSALPQMPSISQMPERETPLLKPMTMEISEGRMVKEGPIFVKIDKFKDAMANFELVKKRLQESSVLLEKIKETRAKEEGELNEWAGELNALKEKVTQIDRKIFSALD